MKLHFETEEITEKKRAVIMNDAAVITKVQGHPNIITVKEVFENGVITKRGVERRVFAIMVIETLRGGELFFHIKQCKSFSVPTARSLFL
jgi:serine/threonine protein kinase